MFLGMGTLEFAIIIVVALLLLLAPRLKKLGSGRHRIVRVLVGVVAAVGLAWVALTVASDVVWGRSAMATLSDDAVTLSWHASRLASTRPCCPTYN